VESPCQIFEKLPEGSIWTESAIGLQQRKERTALFDKVRPDEYFAYDLSEAGIAAERSSILFMG
jgi:hypothetical protein